MAELGSDQWYAGDAYIDRAWMRRGAPDSIFAGRPQIATANTASDLMPCNAHLSEPAAASPYLLQPRGGALVLDSIEDFHARVDDLDLDGDADFILVLRGCGPKGYPGMPEFAKMPPPRKLLERGLCDMERICDGRMSGTAYATVVLHVAPEARRHAEQAATALFAHPERGWERLYVDHVLHRPRLPNRLQWLGGEL